MTSKKCTSPLKKIDERTCNVHLFLLVEFCRVIFDVAAFLEVSFLSSVLVEQTKTKVLIYIPDKASQEVKNFFLL